MTPLFKGASVFPVSSEGPPHSVASYDTRNRILTGPLSVASYDT
jgi:hypothetical protein